jgi:hypothetical protein
MKSKTLEKKSEADPSNANKFNLGSAIKSAKNTLGHRILCDAIIGDIETSQRFLGTNKAPKKPKVSGSPLKVKLASPKKKLGRTIPAPSIIDDPSDIMPTQSNPRIVLDITDYDRPIEKQILGVRKIRKTVNKDLEGETGAVVGWYLLLKYHDKERYLHPSFEMAPGSVYPGAVQAFLKDGGTEFQPSTKDDLRSFQLDDLDICRVATVGARDPAKKNINISQRLMLRVYFRTLNKYMFFYISTLRAKYRAKPINTKRDIYAADSGQKLQLAPSRAKEQEQLQDEIQKLKDEKLEIALGNFPSKRRSKR